MRKTSHTQNKEPFLEYVLSWIRAYIASKNIENGSRVCDLGCGYRGGFLSKISGKISYGEGYDVSVSKKGIPKNIKLISTNLNGSFAKRKKYFDYVTALAVLEHVEKPKKFLKGVRKMLKNDGRVIITTPHKRSKKILEVLSTFGFISSDEIEDHKNYFDENLMKSSLKKSGFKIVKLKTFEIGLNLFCVAQKIT